MKSFLKKYWYLVLGFVVILFWSPLRGVYRKGSFSTQTEIVTCAENNAAQSSVQRTLSDYDLTAIANQIEVDLLGDFSEDEADAMKQVMKCQNSADWFALVSRFGIRKPWGVMREGIALPTALKRYLDSDDYEMLSNYIKGIGGFL